MINTRFLVVCLWIYMIFLRKDIILSNPVKGQKLFEGNRIYCSDITGPGVRSFPDLMFEVERILQLFKSSRGFARL